MKSPIKFKRAFIALTTLALQSEIYALPTLSGVIHPEPTNKIGTVLHPPVFLNEKLYFVSTSGVLFESDPDLKKTRVIAKGSKSSTGALTVYQNKLFWGDGGHDDTDCNLMIYDTKTKNIEKKRLFGHIQRNPFVFKNNLFLGLGPQGVIVLRIQDLKPLWELRTIGTEKLHVDSNFVVSSDGDICFTSIYNFKGIVCADNETGKITKKIKLSYSPKSEILIQGDKVLGIATDAKLDSEQSEPSQIFLASLKEQKIIFEAQTDGYQFFTPVLLKDRAFFSTSAGKGIMFSLVTGKSQNVFELNEPFPSGSLLLRNDHICSVSLGGRWVCFKMDNQNYVKTQDYTLHNSHKAVLSNIIFGLPTELNERIYFPSQKGYLILPKKNFIP